MTKLELQELWPGGSLDKDLISVSLENEGKKGQEGHLLMWEMSAIKTTRLIVLRNNTCKVTLVSSPFLCHLVFAVQSSGSHLAESCFVWDNWRKVFINLSWCGISHPVFPVYNILLTLLTNSIPASSLPVQSSVVLWAIK